METLSQTSRISSRHLQYRYLSGGGSMLRGLDKRISQKTDLPVYSRRSLRAVVRGTGMALKKPFEI
jgi:rod shape-determining protein MreB